MTIRTNPGLYRANGKTITLSELGRQLQDLTEPSKIATGHMQAMQTWFRELATQATDQAYWQPRIDEYRYFEEQQAKLRENTTAQVTAIIRSDLYPPQPSRVQTECNSTATLTDDQLHNQLLDLLLTHKYNL